MPYSSVLLLTLLSAGAHALPQGYTSPAEPVAVDTAQDTALPTFTGPVPVPVATVAQNDPVQDTLAPQDPPAATELPLLPTTTSQAWVVPANTIIVPSDTQIYDPSPITTNQAWAVPTDTIVVPSDTDIYDPVQTALNPDAIVVAKHQVSSFDPATLPQSSEPVAAIPIYSSEAAPLLQSSEPAAAVPVYSSEAAIAAPSYSSESAIEESYPRAIGALAARQWDFETIATPVETLTPPTATPVTSSVEVPPTFSSQPLTAIPITDSFPAITPTFTSQSLTAIPITDSFPAITPTFTSQSLTAIPITDSFPAITPIFTSQSLTAIPITDSFPAITPTFISQPLTAIPITDSFPALPPQTISQPPTADSPIITSIASPPINPIGTEMVELVPTTLATLVRRQGNVWNGSALAN